jgi:hypothetical protein
MHFKGFKPIKLTGEPGPTVGDGHQDRCASDRNAALKTQRSKTVGLFATFTRGHRLPRGRSALVSSWCAATNALGRRGSAPKESGQIPRGLARLRTCLGGPLSPNDHGIRSAMPKGLDRSRSCASPPVLAPGRNSAPRVMADRAGHDLL